jgi:cytochrome b561
MTTNPQQFLVSMRFLHWLMAAMVLTMLGIGVGMVASLADYHRLVSIHRPAGILILMVIRFVNRRFSTLPPFPARMSSQERFIAHASEMLLYRLLILQPLFGKGMLSAARYPIILYGQLHLFPILPHSVMLYAALRKGHTVLAYLLFLTFIAHFGAVLFHTLVLRDRCSAAWRLIESSRASKFLQYGPLLGVDVPQSVSKICGAGGSASNCVPCPPPLLAKRADCL